MRIRNDQTTWYKAPFFLSEILVHDMIQILILVPMFPDKGLFGSFLTTRTTCGSKEQVALGLVIRKA